MDETISLQTGPLWYVTLATVFNSLITFGAQVTAARSLGVEGFGLLSLAIAIVFLTETVGDFGVGVTLVRLFNKKACPERSQGQAGPIPALSSIKGTTINEEQRLLLGSVLLFRILLIALLFLFSIPLGYLLVYGFGVGRPVLRASGFANSGLMLFALAFITGGLILLWTYLLCFFQCLRSFGKLAVWTIAYAVLRLVSVALVYLLGQLSAIRWLLWVYTIPVFLLIVVQLPKFWAILKPAIERLQPSWQPLRDVFAYSKWVALSVGAYTAMPYLVRFILAQRSSIAAVGIFSAGMTFALAFTTLNTAVRTVLFPQVTALNSAEKMKRYLRKLKNFAPKYLVVALLGIGLLSFLQWVLLGERYREALPVFLVTVPSFAMVLFIGMETMLLHTMMRPELDAYVDITRLLIVVLLSLLVAPLGATAVAVVYAGSLLGGAIVKLKILKKLLKQVEKVSNDNG